MLQYKTQHPTRYSIAEQAQMAIEGGCTWIQLSSGCDDDIAIRDICSILIPLCRETSTILTIENRPELAKELGVHGILIKADSGLNARSVREEFGPEAIIGVQVADPSAILSLKGADIDYVVLSMPLDRASVIIEQAKEANNTIPIVIAGDFSLQDVQKILNIGASGILTGKDIANADDPVLRTEQFLEALTSK